MSKKDYIKIAQVLFKCKPHNEGRPEMLNAYAAKHGQWLRIVASMSSMLQHNNSDFAPDKFMDYCYNGGGRVRSGKVVT